jgi:hypothetical protein
VVHLLHREHLCPLEPRIDIPILLIAQLRVFAYPNEGTASSCKVFNHQLSEAVVWVVHLIIEEKGEIKPFTDIGDHLIDSIRFDIAEHTLTVEESRQRWVYFMSINDGLNLRNIGQVAGGQYVPFPQNKLMLMLCITAYLHDITGFSCSF